MDRNHAVNLKDYPVKEFNLFFSVRRVQEDLYKNEKPGTRVWTGAIQISGTFNNGKLSPRPIVELWPMFNNKIEFSGPAMTPSKPWTWDMVGGSDIWSTAAKINQQQAVFSENEDLNEQSTKEDKVVSCASLGVKTPGYCEIKSKKPVKPCAELGVKTIGYCYVDTKQPINEDLNEQNPLMGLIRGFTSPAVKILRRGALMSDVIASPAVKSLITKYGTVAMSDFVKGALRPFEDNMVILINDYKKLQSFKVPGVSQYDNVAFLNQQIDSIKRGLVPAGKDKGIGLDYLYTNTYRLSTYIDEIIAAKQVKPQGVALLKGMKQTANRALESLEDAIGQIATKK